MKTLTLALDAHCRRPQSQSLAALQDFLDAPGKPRVSTRERHL